jgi:hypothetical protein
MKKLRCGGLVCVLLWVCAGVVWAQWPLGKEMGAAVKEQEHGLYVTGSGRFQIFTSPQAKGFTFMVDSDTGRVWVMKKDHTSGEFSFQRVPVRDLDSNAADVRAPAAKGDKGK